jgi:HAD superfamily phosphatase (TIGR01668 family)
LIKAIIFDIGNTLLKEDSGQAYPHVIDTLKQLKDKYRLAVISNVLPTTPAEKVHQILRESQLLDFFEFVLVSSELGVSKPDTKIFNVALEKMNVKPEEVVIVGNTISTDIFGGNRVGMKTILIQPSVEYQRSEWEKPTYTVSTIKDILNII